VSSVIINEHRSLPIVVLCKLLYFVLRQS